VTLIGRPVDCGSLAMYTPVMRRLRSPLLVLACLGLLATQMSGLHMHVDADGYVGIPEGTHVHRTAVHPHDGAPVGHAHGVAHDHPGDPDHERERDVTVIELGAGASKLLIFFAWLGLGLVIVLRAGSKIRMPAVVPPPTTRRDRWRPPLRAPPSFSHSLSHCTR